jgi:hypothetical protein
MSRGNLYALGTRSAPLVGGSTVYVVSLHNHSAINREIELAIAANIAMVPPA